MDFLTHLADSLVFGIAVAFIVLGLIGTIIPALPGPILILLTILGYGWVDGWMAPSGWMIGVMVVLMLVTGSADLWLPYLGVRSSGGNRRVTIYAFIGSIIGLFYLPPFGPIIGYAIGVLLGSYQLHRDWRVALRASLIGVAGWGVATAIQLGGGIIVLILFVWSTLFI